MKKEGKEKFSSILLVFSDMTNNDHSVSFFDYKYRAEQLSTSGYCSKKMKNVLFFLVRSQLKMSLTILLIFTRKILWDI